MKCAVFFCFVFGGGTDKEAFYITCLNFHAIQVLCDKRNIALELGLRSCVVVLWLSIHTRG